MNAVFDTLKGIANARAEAIRARDARLEQQAIEKAVAEYKRFKVPPLGEGQISFMWATDCVVDIECVLDHTPAEGDNWNDPYYPEDVTLCAAYLRGVDIYELLSPEQITRIEEKALEQIADDRKGMEEERAEWLGERMRDREEL
jgi:hypothetical protein